MIISLIAFTKLLWPILVVLAGVIGVVLGILFDKKKAKPIVAGPTCKIGQIPEAFERLKSQRRNGSFVVFIFQPPDRPDADDAINLQFSIEHDRVGLDWCLIGPANIQDRKKFERFVASLGHKAHAREMNGVEYLRVEDGDLPRLCQRIVSELYKQTESSELDMVVEGFSWR